MTVPVTALAKRWGVLLLASAFAGITAFSAAQFWRADRWMSSSALRDWEKAARIEPGNADYWDRIGRFLQLDFANYDLPRAAGLFQRATENDPWQADYWLDLASAYENLGDAARASSSFLKAKEAYPLSSDVTWQYGNFLLREGRLAEALTEIRAAVTVKSDLVPLAASRCWHATGDINRVLSEILPAKSESYLAALNAFVDEHALDPALATWRRLMRLDAPVELRAANPLVDALLDARRIDDALTVWREALISSGTVPKDMDSFPLINNGGFERNTSAGGFDWRTYPAPGVHYDYDATVAHSGARSLRITFEGTSNATFLQVQQTVAVQPRTHYKLSAFLRSESITTESGLRLMVARPMGMGTPDVFTADVTGTQGWKPYEVEFTTGPETRRIEVYLCRLSSVKQDSKIRGIAWVDDVALVPIASRAREAKP